MIYTADNYYKQQNLADYHLVSTMGFTEDDIAAINQISRVRAAAPGYGIDAFIEHPEGEVIAHISSLPADTGEENPAFFNRPVIKEGRMPTAANECVADDATAYQIGDTLYISPVNNGDTTDMFAVRELKIVGRVQSPAYIMMNRGNTNIGDGKINFFLYTTAEAFDSEFYTEVYLSFKETQDVSSFSKDYQRIIDEGAIQLEAFGKERAQVRYDDIYSEAIEELNDAKKELADGRKEADEKLADAWQEILDGEAEIADGWDEIRTNEQKLKDALADITNGERDLADAERQLADGEAALADGRRTLEASQAEYESGLNQYNSGLSQYNSNKEQLDTLDAAVGAIPEALGGMAALTASGTQDPAPEMLGAYLEAAGGVMQAAGGMAQYLYNTADENAALLADALSGVVQGAQTALNAANENSAGYFMVYAALSALDENGALYPQMAGALLAGQQALAEGKAVLDASAAQLASAASQIDAGWAEINANEGTLAAARAEIANGRAEIEDAKKEVADGQTELADGRKELADAEAELADGKKEYEEEKTKAEKEIADGEKEISDAEEKLAELEIPEWFVRTRADNPGYSGFSSDADRIDAIAIVVPIFFFLVAALVCLTTMTRMVEEQRVFIGGLKALGYSNSIIAFKYLLYAAFASTTGAIAGVIGGFFVFPNAIWSAYSMMYLMPKLSPAGNYALAFASIAATVLCTTLATLGACMNELRASPASLMRPKAPRPGKRVLLERVAPLWRRMSFMQKVTVRNLFRYKKRFFMTVIGVAGCTALLLTGFGLRDSISGIVPRQYGNIYKYDMRAVLKDPSSAAMPTELNDYLKTIGEGMYFMEEAIEASSATETSADMSVYLFVAENPQGLESFIDFSDRKSGEKIAFPNGEGAVITEKLASRLKVEAGDSINLDMLGWPEVSVTISGIMENYVLNTVYITPQTFEKIYGEPPEYINLMLNLSPEAQTRESEVLRAVIDMDNVAGAVDINVYTEELDDMFESLNSVVWVIILSAAMLAFVVLYNLTNINITERTREIATLKVLGFYGGEVASYIYRENLLLTLIGTAGGLGLGVILHRFVIKTAEIDEVMFRRVVEFPSYIYAIVLTLACAGIVNLVMLRRLKKVDMVESLKSTE